MWFVAIVWVWYSYWLEEGLGKFEHFLNIMMTILTLKVWWSNEEIHKFWDQKESRIFFTSSTSYRKNDPLRLFLQFSIYINCKLFLYHRFWLKLLNVYIFNQIALVWWLMFLSTRVCHRTSDIYLKVIICPPVIQVMAHAGY